LRDAFVPLPFKEPSQTLLSLLGILVDSGRRFASIADIQVVMETKMRQSVQQLLY